MAKTPKRLDVRLRQLRLARGLSQAALAKQAQITREYVNGLERGRSSPTVKVVQRLAKALRVKPSALLD